jgi:hypothetical protein
MNPKFPRAAILALAALLIAGCGGGSMLPFGMGGGTELSRKPANATEYRCAGGKGFFVRTLDANALWLIAPDREIRLEKLPGAESGRYGVGKVVLEMGADEATLFDPPTQYAGCKRADAAR